MIYTTSAMILPEFAPFSNPNAPSIAIAPSIAVVPSFAVALPSRFPSPSHCRRTIDRRG